MKQTVLTIITIFLFFTSQSQPLPSQKEQYAFLQWYATSKHIKEVKLTTNAIDWGWFFRGSEPLRKKLHIELKELDHFYLQLSGNKKVTMLDTTLLKNIPWKRPGAAPSPFYSLSLPLFTRDKKLAVVYIEDNNMQLDPGISDIGFEVYVKNGLGKWELSEIQPFGKGRSISIAHKIPEGQE